MAHELGHNLGMSHDFTDTGNRFSNGNPCTSVGGIMDYIGNNPVRGRESWSPCSNEDFRSTFNAYGGTAGYCLIKQHGGERTIIVNVQGDYVGFNTGNG